MKCNEIFTKGFPKNLKDFASKRQVKHTSTVLEPSIPFHTLVKLVDAEDIANDKIRTHDLSLGVNTITKQLQTQTLDSSNQEQLMFTQPRDPNNNKTGTSKVGAISKAQEAQFSKYAQDVFMKSFENTFETPKVCLSCSI